MMYDYSFMIRAGVPHKLKALKERRPSFLPLVVIVRLEATLFISGGSAEVLVYFTTQR
jgi:hypothetical protein